MIDLADSAGQLGPFSTELTELEQALQAALHHVQTMPRETIHASDWLETAALVGECLGQCRDTLARARDRSVGGARSALLAYFRSHPGETLSPHKLEGVAAIRAWARRIRELREFGWDIAMVGSGSDAPYRLASDRLDEGAASSDKVLEAVSGSTSRDRLLEYLLHISPWPASSDQLERVTRTPTWRQDIGELIEDGWLIQSHEDDPEVPPGSYRLANLEV